MLDISVDTDIEIQADTCADVLCLSGKRFLTPVVTNDNAAQETIWGLAGWH